MIRRAAFAFLAVVTTVAAIVAINTLRQGSQQITVGPSAAIPVDSQAVSARLAGAIRFRTISFEDPSAETLAQLLEFHSYIERSFPRLHASLQRELVNGYSLLYTWKGEDGAAKPILLMAHQDDRLRGAILAFPGIQQAVAVHELALQGRMKPWECALDVAVKLEQLRQGFRRRVIKG